MVASKSETNPFLIRYGHSSAHFNPNEKVDARQYKKFIESRKLSKFDPNVINATKMLSNRQ